jgi:recombination protein RecA
LSVPASNVSGDGHSSHTAPAPATKGEAMPAPADREKALDTALAQIDRQFGKGSVMRLGDDVRAPIAVIPTGSIALDVALGIGGLPRGRVVEIYGPESSGKTTVALHAVANAQREGGIAAFIDAEHALDPEYAKRLGVDTDALLVSQPDTGEQALEIADMLIRSGALDVIVIDSVAALVPRAEIEGEMGDSHVGLQARLMSQALRKITGALSSSGTTAIFINQLREKIGVMFGCVTYETPITLGDGSRKKIGEIVDEKAEIEVLSYDPSSGDIAPRRVTNWFDNGPTKDFVQLAVRTGGTEKGHPGTQTLEVTHNHLVRTPGGWREAGDIAVGDRVMVPQPVTLSDQQWQVILGGVMGYASLIEPAGRDGCSAGFRMGHARRQAEYLDWKASLLRNIKQSRAVRRDGSVHIDVTPLAELGDLREVVYFGGGKKHLTWDYLKALGPLALAIWYMDDGGFTLRSGGLQESTAGGSGRAEICVDAMSPGSRERVRDHLRDAFGLEARLHPRGARQVAVLTFSTAATARLHELIAPCVHPSMDYKLLPRFQGKFDVTPQFRSPALHPLPARVIGRKEKHYDDPVGRYDIEVEGSSNYVASGVMVHNSPETTTGGRALKFYASVRLDVRRIETLKDGSEAVGNRTKVKVVKNKLSPPFKQAELDIIYGHGISREGGLIDMGVEHGFVRKSGAWYTYEGDQLGQGKENARAFLRDNPDLADEIEKRIKEKLGVGPRVDAPAEPPVDF